MRSVIVAGLTLTGAGLLAGCAGAGGGGELTSATAAGLIEAHPEFQNPANLGVYGGTPELIEVSSISAEGGSRATAEFTWMYNRDFQGTKGNVPSTLYYTRMLDGRPPGGQRGLLECQRRVGDREPGLAVGVDSRLDPGRGNDLRRPTLDPRRHAPPPTHATSPTGVACCHGRRPGRAHARPSCGALFVSLPRTPAGPEQAIPPFTLPASPALSVAWRGAITATHTVTVVRDVVSRRR